MLQGFFDHQLLDLGQKGIAVIQLKNTKFPYSSDYFASHKLPLQPNTILYNTHRLARRNYAAGHQKLLSLAGGSAVDVLLILQWKSACERQFQSDLGFKVLLLFRRELSLSKKQSEYSWNVSSSSENKSQKPKSGFAPQPKKPRLRSDTECFTAFVCVAIDARRPFPIPVT